VLGRKARNPLDPSQALFSDVVSASEAGPTVRPAGLPRCGCTLACGPPQGAFRKSILTGAVVFLALGIAYWLRRKRARDDHGWLARP
jgi:hypothetical protein